MSSTVFFYADYTKAGVGTAPSSPPTLAIYSVNRGNSAETAIQTTAAMVASAMLGRYFYRLAGADLQTYDYHARAHTTDATVDVQDPPALWVRWSEAVATDSAGAVAANNLPADYQQRAVAVTLPAVPADWLTAAGVKADAVTKIQAGLSTYGGGAVASVTAPVTAGTVTDKSGYSLSATGLDAIDPTEPVAPSSAWNFRQWLRWAVMRQVNAARTPTQLTVKTKAGATSTTQTVADDGAGTESTGATS